MNSSLRAPAVRLKAILSVSLAAIAAIVCPAFAQKAGQSAGDTYLAYVAVVQNMKSPDELKPFMPKAIAEMIGRMPKEMKTEMMDAARKETATNVKVVKETRLGDAHILELEGTRNGARAKGWAKMTLEDGAFKVAKDDWAGGPPPAAPKIPASVAETGKAVGEFTVKGKTAQLKYAYARAIPYSFDKTKTEYEVTLSDAPWSPTDYNQIDKVKAGTLHFIQLTIGPDKHVTGTMLRHHGFNNGTMSSAGGQHKFESQQFGPDIIAGRVYLEAPEEALGEMYYYAATFKAAIEKSK